MKEIEYQIHTFFELNGTNGIIDKIGYNTWLTMLSTTHNIYYMEFELSEVIRNDHERKTSPLLD